MRALASHYRDLTTRAFSQLIELLYWVVLDRSDVPKLKRRILLLLQYVLLERSKCLKLCVNNVDRGELSEFVCICI